MKGSRWRESIPEQVSDPADGIADSGGSREGNGDKAANAKEEVPGNQDVIEIDQDEKEGTPLYTTKHQWCATEMTIIMNESVRGKSPIGQSTTTW